MKPTSRTTNKILCILTLLCGKLVSPAYGQLNPIPLTASSYNNDLIAESGSNPHAVTTAALDGSGNNILYSIAFQAANSSELTSGGLPNNGTITNSGNTWQLTSYSSSNALFFGPQSAVSTATISLSTPLPYTEISLLDAAGYGPTSVTITLHFSDGSSTNYGTYSILDWFDNTPYVTSSLGRINRNNTVSNNNAPATDPRLYQTIININGTDQTKKLSQITIQDNSTNNLATAAFFAVSGIATSTLALADLNLNGQYQAATNSVHLEWGTTNADQIAGGHYEIQRSADGSVFAGLSSISSASDNNYSYSDNSVQSGASYYYRILATAPSGEQVYSNLIHVQVPGTMAQSSVSQSGDLLYVNTGSSGQPLQYAVYSIAGQEYIRGVPTSGNSFTVNLHALAHGIYFIRLQRPTGSQAIEFLH